MTQYVYRFGGGVDDGGKNGVTGDKTLLGGKGANLAEMTSLGMPVPQGFTITTEACTNYYQNNKNITVNKNLKLIEKENKDLKLENQILKDLLKKTVLVWNNE